VSGNDEGADMRRLLDELRDLRDRMARVARDVEAYIQDHDEPQQPEGTVHPIRPGGGDE
jgi:hypothetical protein